jgi:hypothetical protein
VVPPSEFRASAEMRERMETRARELRLEQAG